MIMYFEYINKNIIVLKYFYMCLGQFNNIFIVLVRYLIENLSLKELIHRHSRSLSRKATIENLSLKELIRYKGIHSKHPKND